MIVAAHHVHLPIRKSYTRQATRKANKVHLVLVAHSTIK